MLRHERQTVAMELAAALHHSRDAGLGTYDGPRAKATAGEEVENATHNVLRHQKTPHPGERPGILAEPGPQQSDRTVRHSAGDSHPTPGLPVLAEVSGDAVDASCHALLVRRAVEKEVAKLEKRRREIQQQASAAMEQATLARGQ